MKQSLKNFLWLLLLIAFSACTLILIIAGAKGFSFGCLINSISRASPFWIALAFICSFGYVYFEGMGLRCTCRFFGCDFGRGKAILFSATDTYFSALTPSASGGQPAALLMMMSRGVPAPVAAVALMLNLIMYTVCIVLLSLLCFVLCPDMVLRLDTVTQLFIYFGFVIAIVCTVLFVLCIVNGELVLRISRGTLRLCRRLHIVKNYEKHYLRLEKNVAHYNQCGAVLKNERTLLFKVFLYNLAQRISVIAVCVCVFSAVGGDAAKAPLVFCAQVFAIVGSNGVPIPGAVGIVEYIFLQAFRGVIFDPISVVLISRGISFYSNLLLCGSLVLINSIRSKIYKQD